MGSKKDKKDKDKDGKRDKKEKKEKSKKSKKHKRRSSSDSSDSDDDYESAEKQLQRERAAVNKLRDVLSLYPAVRKELREMLWRVDQGEAADISSVPDPDLKSQLGQFLELLRLRRNDKGVYGLGARNDRTLSIVGFVFDEPPRPRPAPAPAPAPAPSPAAGPSGAAGAAKGEPEAGPSRRVGPIGPAGPPPRVIGEGDGEVAPYDAAEDGDDDTATGRSKDQPRTAGPAGPPVKSEPMDEEPSSAPELAPEPAPRRVAGPAMPPKELLEAAAAAAEALAAAGPGAVWGEDGDGDGGLLVGPPPPELVLELDAAPQDDREAEVIRIMKVIREHGGSDPDHLDAYSVLGVTAETPPGEVKKRYMRLSLLIHPDKCQHAMAHDAFQAVATAAKVLQDSGLRSKLDARREDAELRKRAAEAAEAMERERAWRVARGEEAPDAGGSGRGPAGPSRETWMTELPPEIAARPVGQMSQVSVRAFSARGKTARGDTSAWTDNPEQRKAKEAQALLEAASAAYVRALPSTGPAGPGSALALATSDGAGSGRAAASALDSFEAGQRKKTLMELHLELQEKKTKDEAKAARKAAKKQKIEGKGEDAGDTGDYPWRPFDREKDLAIKPKAKTGADLLKNAAALGNKFGSGGTQRHFL